MALSHRRDGKRVSDCLKPTAFDRYHPVVAAAFFACAIAYSMVAFHPACIVASLVAGFCYSAYVRGLHASLRTALWQVPLVAIVAVANPIFSASGSTELFRLGLRAVYLESVVYGACMGGMLVSMMLWFSNASHVLSSDKVMSLLGNALPTLALVLSMALRLVPRFVQRGAEIDLVQNACARVRPSTAKEKTASRIRMASVLMGWSMEDSLDVADAMRARGWGAAVRRTTYARHRFRSRDAVALATVLLLAGVCGAFAWSLCSQFSFYPRLSPSIAWWQVVFCFAFLCLPLFAQLGEEIRWMR